ncbi:DUF1819 family protein [Myroides sp. NP-2]|uniref:BrxA family protein n=1 Tax=Myroides sp. NP-2 TaxID=2759945 RepID=UPI0015FE3FE4|nr:BrxA family protein [Myroides sp. NP-2]MBB1151449.1 DUF1819 family protein [Myroides sp. NP-2]
MNYSLSFTGGALLYEESKILINSVTDLEKYFEGDFILNSDVLKTNSESSRKRLKNEIDRRLKKLNTSYITFFNDTNETDQKIILFLSICKLYNIITEFCLEVVYKKWINFDNELSTYDFKYFLANKLSEEQLNSISEGTHYKLSQIAIKIFKDLGMYKDGIIQPIKPSDRLIDLLNQQKDIWFFDCILVNGKSLN